MRLPQFFIYHAVVAALGPALDDIVDLVATNAFRQEKINEDWDKFISVADRSFYVALSAIVRIYIFQSFKRF
jgi:hypothetical protein